MKRIITTAGLATLLAATPVFAGPSNDIISYHDAKKVGNSIIITGDDPYLCKNPEKVMHIRDLSKDKHDYHGYKVPLAPGTLYVSEEEWKLGVYEGRTGLKFEEREDPRTGAIKTRVSAQHKSRLDREIGLARNGSAIEVYLKTPFSRELRSNKEYDFTSSIIYRGEELKDLTTVILDEEWRETLDPQFKPVTLDPGQDVKMNMCNQTP